MGGRHGGRHSGGERGSCAAPRSPAAAPSAGHTRTGAAAAASQRGWRLASPRQARRAGEQGVQCRGCRCCAAHLVVLLRCTETRASMRWKAADCASARTACAALAPRCGCSRVMARRLVPAAGAGAGGGQAAEQPAQRGASRPAAPLHAAGAGCRRPAAASAGRQAAGSPDNSRASGYRATGALWLGGGRPLPPPAPPPPGEGCTLGMHSIRPSTPGPIRTCAGGSVRRSATSSPVARSPAAQRPAQPAWPTPGRCPGRCCAGPHQESHVREGSPDAILEHEGRLDIRPCGVRHTFGHRAAIERNVWQALSGDWRGHGIGDMRHVDRQPRRCSAHHGAAPTRGRQSPGRARRRRGYALGVCMSGSW
jgi:hypothetical protein